MTVKIYQVDSFTTQIFHGNPAAVCLLDREREEEWYKRVAQEMNLSETAFLVPEQNAFRLRWFTPKTEVDLCGHATLASAHILWSENVVQMDEEIQFKTNSGVLHAQLLEDGWIQLNFPVVPYEEAECPIELQDALGAKPLFVARSDFDYLVELDTVQSVKSLQPNFERLAKLSRHGVIVTARSADGPYDFVSRVFCPSLGIPEDPVTGSAHCTLALYWQQKLQKDRFYAFQASERGGELFIDLRDERVFLRGQAITVLRGELTEGGS